MRRLRSLLTTRDSGEVEMVRAGRRENPDNVRRLEGVVTARDWDHLFLTR